MRAVAPSLGGWEGARAYTPGCMIYIIYFKEDETLLNRIGVDELQHYSNLKDFRPLLEKRGTVVQVEKPEDQVDGVYQFAHYLGEPALCLSFTSPDQDDFNILCPKFFPSTIFPPPVWDNYDKLANLNTLGHPPCKPVSTNGDLIDSSLENLLPASVTHFMPLNRSLQACWLALKKSKYRLALVYLLRRKSIHYFPAELILTGVVYTAVIRRTQPFKNWKKLINEFCSVFRDKPDATLVLKMVGAVKASTKKAAVRQLKRKSIACRVVIINAHLPQEQYEHLVCATSFIINNSTGNEIGKSLLEFMSAGKPAISPKIMETGPLNKENSFIASATQGSLGSIREPLEESYFIKKDNPARYHSMSKDASERMKSYCSIPVVEPKLFAWLDGIEATQD